MGRNDFSSLVDLSKLVIISALIAFFFFAADFYLYAQQEPLKGKKEEFTFKVLQKYTPTKPYVYKYTQRDTVIRVFSDSSEKRFQREVIYYMTLVAEDPPEEGFITVTASVDSLKYKMKEGEAVFEYNSQQEYGSTGIEFDDMESYNVLLGRMMDITLSPYGEVTDVSGESLEWIRNYVENGKDQISEKKYFIWNEGLSDENIAHLADMRKLEVPLGYLKIDTTWHSPMEINIGGINFAGDATALLKDYETASILIAAPLDSLVCRQKKDNFYGIKELVTISGAAVKGNFQVTVNHLGAVDLAIARAEAEVDARIKKEKFKEYIFTEMKWELMARYSY